MKEDAFIDCDNKIITECPECSEQHCLYMITGNKIMDNLQIQYCDNCHKPYVVELDVTFEAKIETYGCYKTKRNEQGFIKEDTE